MRILAQLFGLVLIAMLATLSPLDGSAQAAETKTMNEAGSLSSTASPADPEAVQIGQLVAAVLKGQPADAAQPDWLTLGPGLAYVALRRRGEVLAAAWKTGENGREALEAAVAAVAAAEGDIAEAEVAEVVIARQFRSLSFQEWRRFLTNINRGLLGLVLTHQEAVRYVAPTEMIAGNRSFKTSIQEFAGERQLDEQRAITELGLRVFQANQFLVRLDRPQQTVRLLRGGRLVPLETVTRDETAALIERMSGWMFGNLNPDGRMTYKYWPSHQRESEANNMIRQWMASLCMVRLARRAGDPRLVERSETNIRYNLEQFYREADGLGYIFYEEKAKLGAAALAALALAEHPNRAAFAAQEAGLRRMIDHLWQDDGSFITFLLPEGRNDVQNFYPGEALLYLARIYQETKDSELLARIMRSYEYYRAWHLENRNPAFIPWHTMAYAIVWRETRDPALRDWIFEMNDWLIGIQQEGTRIAPDIDGRFYDPQRSQFGPPHASATGVYIESLIQAYRVAVDADDRTRAASYRRALVRAIRSIMQLEYNDEAEMYYITEPARVAGGVRTTVYDNEIRVDNVQHALMGLLEIFAVFDAQDYEG
jgi:hypothetical protein